MRRAGFLTLMGAAGAVLAFTFSPPVRADEVSEMARLMAGHFSSRAQHERDPAYDPVELHVVPVWPGRSDGTWLYVEQHMAATPERPYRQRFYQLRPAAGGAVEVIVHQPAEPTALVGAWKEPARLERASPDALKPLTGCEMRFTRQGAAFAGGTDGRKCPNGYKGAAAMSSEITLDMSATRIWDRGWTADGQHAWGPKGGGYVFDRQR
ncbi:MAG TPA: chromophore lyase CpcT/CpeT [Azospirillaceae bacterium]|nr:chromophore lyase CpcT/CpeT [Azospirillaceae bacterium]